MEATDKWSINIDNGLLNGVILIDLKKAFDTIDHTILLRKLQMYGVDQNGIKFFESYLSNRSQRCCVNDELSDAVKITCGVSQGSFVIQFSSYLTVPPDFFGPPLAGNPGYATEPVSSMNNYTYL